MSCITVITKQLHHVITQLQILQTEKWSYLQL